MGRIIRFAAALSAFLAIGAAGAAGAVPASATPAAPTGHTTVCSLRVDDWTSDCLRLALGLTRGPLIPGSPSFDWKFVATGAANTYTIHDRTMDHCVDVFGSGVNAPVVLSPCDGRASQTWIIEVHRPAGPFGMYHPIRNGFSQLHLTFETVPGTPLPSPVVQRPFQDLRSQYFGLLGPA